MNTYYLSVYDHEAKESVIHYVSSNKREMDSFCESFILNYILINGQQMNQFICHDELPQSNWSDGDRFFIRKSSNTFGKYTVVKKIRSCGYLYNTYENIKKISITISKTVVPIVEEFDLDLIDSYFDYQQLMKDILDCISVSQSD